MSTIGFRTTKVLACWSLYVSNNGNILNIIMLVLSALSRHEKTDSDIQTFTMSTLKDLFAYDYINYQN